MTLRESVGRLLSREVGPSSPLYPDRLGGSAAGIPRITEDDAMRNSSVWSALRVRANLISSLDVHCYMNYVDPTGDRLSLEVALPPVMVEPSPGIDFAEFMYSSQVDLDRYGNCFGLIKQTDRFDLPMRIDLVPAADVRVRLAKDGTVSYRIGSKEYERKDVWHERQYTVAGLPVGLSPISYAAMTIAQSKSAQGFAINWYTHNAVPAGHLKNVDKRLDAGEARLIKDRFEAAMQGGGAVFVTGKEWEFSPVVAESNDSVWLNAMQASAADVARFFDVPGDLIGAPAGAGSSITYANITQRFVQLLTVHLGPTLKRRRNAFTARMLPKPRFVEFDTEQLLAMDPAALSTMLGQQIRDRIRTPNEVRNSFYNLPDLDEADLAEYTAAFTTTPAVPTAQPVAAPTDGSTE